MSIRPATAQEADSISDLALRAKAHWGYSVVTHGDLTLANLLVDPERATVTGFIDLGRAGRADLALLLETAREIWPDAAQARARFEQIYGRALDPVRLRNYLHLDPLTWG